MFALLCFLACAASALAEFDGCVFDGRQYQAGEMITIKCLGQMKCLGNYNLGPFEPEPSTNCKRDDGQTGCLFDGHVYNTGDVIVISDCLGQTTCLGNNTLAPLQQATNCKRDDGQTGCLFDGTVYNTGDEIMIGHCLATMTCEGNDSYSFPVALSGNCPS